MSLVLGSIRQPRLATSTQAMHRSISNRVLMSLLLAGDFRGELDGPYGRMPRSPARISAQLTATARTAIGADHAVGYSCKTARRCFSTSDDVTESVAPLSTSKRIIDSTTVQNWSEITTFGSRLNRRRLDALLFRRHALAGYPLAAPIWSGIH